MTHNCEGIQAYTMRSFKVLSNRSSLPFAHISNIKTFYLHSSWFCGILVLWDTLMKYTHRLLTKETIQIDWR